MNLRWLHRFFKRKPLIKESVGDIYYRNMMPQDSISDLTNLINKAYKIYADMGLNYVATNQSVETTLKRIRKATCIIALDKNRIIGTISYKPAKRTKGSDWYNKAFVAKFNQLAVDPIYQEKGIGGKLVEIVERIAIKQGVSELALDTSEEAENLINYYKRKKYRFIEYLQWDFTNYRSVILSKKL